MRNQLEGSTTSADEFLDLLGSDNAAFFLGCLLGDGWLGLQRQRFAHLRIGHSDKQVDWLQWKADHLNRIFGKSRELLGPYEVGCGSSDKVYLHYLYVIDDNRVFRPLFDRLYSYRANRPALSITPSLLARLDLQSLAIYWCDDGSLWSGERFTKYIDVSGNERRYSKVETGGAIACCDRTPAEVELLQQWIERLTGVRFKISRQKKYLILRAGKKAMREFIPQIAPFVPNCMSHKVDLSHCRIG